MTWQPQQQGLDEVLSLLRNSSVGDSDVQRAVAEVCCLLERREWLMGSAHRRASKQSRFSRLPLLCSHIMSRRGRLTSSRCGSVTQELAHLALSECGSVRWRGAGICQERDFAGLDGEGSDDPADRWRSHCGITGERGCWSLARGAECRHSRDGVAGYQFGRGEQRLTCGKLILGLLQHPCKDLRR